MQYITYEEYTEIGGLLDLTAFKRNVDRACGVIDGATHNRIEHMAEVPRAAKALCRDLVDYFATCSASDAGVSSRSQSSGSVSESYQLKNKEEQAQAVENMILDHLMAAKDDNGTPLLYRGCCV